MPKIIKRTVDALIANPVGRDVFFWDQGDGALECYACSKLGWTGGTD
jgi:hypothetical protein